MREIILGYIGETTGWNALNAAEKQLVVIMKEDAQSLSIHHGKIGFF